MILRLPSVASSKNPAAYPMFRGQITRGLWRVYTQRLTPAGRWLLLTSAILLCYGGASLQIQAYVLASYVVAVWAIALLATILVRPKMELLVQFPRRVQRGGTLPVRIELIQQRRMHGGDVSVAAYNLPASIDAVEPDGVSVPDLAYRQSHRTQLELLFTRRGLERVEGFRVTSSFPFGILRSRQTFRRPHDVLVYPSFDPIRRLTLPTAAGHDANAELIASRLGESFEFLGNREFREGDNPRDINWRATARMPEPIVREWIEERQFRATIVLDTFLPRSSGAGRLEDLERAISLAAALTDYLSRNGMSLGQLVIGGEVELQSVGRHSPDLQSVLDTLAVILPTHEPADLPRQVYMAAERSELMLLVLLGDDEPRQKWIREISEISPMVKPFIINSAAAGTVVASATHLTADDFRNGLQTL